ncbi:MAG: HD domain-containing phosphohydrolase [bacterium]
MYNYSTMADSIEKFLDDYLPITTIDQSIKLEKEIAFMKDKAIKARSLLEVGLVESFRKNYDKAIKFIEEAQKFYLEEKDYSQIAVCLAELALIHYKNCNERLIRSLTLLNDAKAILESQQDKVETEAKILHYYGIINYHEIHYSEALKYFKAALYYLKPDSLEYAKVLDSFAVFYLRINNYQIATKYLEKSLKIKRLVGNSLELSITELLFGRYLSSIENYEDAVEHLKNALVITENIGDYSTSSRVYEELAKIFLQLNNIDEAEYYCRKSIDFAVEVNSDYLIAFAKSTFAHVSLLKGDSQSALQIIENEVEPVFEKNALPRGLAFIKKIRAMILRHQKKFREAIELFHEAIELFADCSMRNEIARTYLELALTYEDSQDPQMAVSSLLEALRIARENDLNIIINKVEDKLFEIDEDEWASVINKAAKKEPIFSDNTILLDSISLLGDLTKGESPTRDPLLSLLKIGRSIAAETDVNKLLEIIALETKKALNADRCTVFLLDKETNELWSKVALGMGSQEIRFPANIGLAGHVAATGETINITDSYDDPRFNKEIDKKTGYKTKTILCMPMRNLNHEIIGVFQVLNKLNNQTFSDDDEDLIIAIGSSAGIALENARLFQKQQLMNEELKCSFTSFINTLAASIDARDKITAGHSKRVTLYTLAIARQLNLSKAQIDILEHASLLHDFGKIGIRDSVLMKEGKLTPEEYKHIQEHVSLTGELLSKMYFDEKFKEVPEIACSHHERWDGKGYHRGLEGENIPLGGRILAVSDVFDAITSKRHYRDRMPFNKVLNIIKGDAGTHFDVNIVESFFALTLFDIINIMLTETDTEVENQDMSLLTQALVNDLYIAYNLPVEERSAKNNNVILLFEKYYLVKDSNII